MPMRRAGSEDGPASTNSYSPAFDWLRFALALIVLLDHGGGFGDKAGTRMGGLAVHVFFVLSGWLIGGILLNTTRCVFQAIVDGCFSRSWTAFQTNVDAVSG